MNEIYSYKTAFVRNIPPSCSNDHLNEVFSAFGPIKECFVVKPSNEDADQKKRLFGFVTFQSHDDCKSAINAPSILLDKVKVTVTLAKKKRFSKSIKAKEKRQEHFKLRQEEKLSSKKDESDSDIEIVPIEKHSNSVNQALHQDTGVDKGQTKKTKHALPPTTTIVVISGFPSSYTIENFVSLWKDKQFILPEQFTIVPTADSSTNVAHAEMKSKQAALKIVYHLNGEKYGDTLLKATLRLDPNTKDFRKSAKRSRLIVRNLNFQCTEEDLRNVFDRYGTVTNVELPQRDNGTRLGYGFVQLSHVYEAMKAVREINMTEIKGRKVAVDWALSREKFKKLNLTEPSEETQVSPDSGDEADIEDDDEEFDNSMSDNDSAQDEETDDYSEEEDESDYTSTDEDADSGVDNDYKKDLENAAKSLKKSKKPERRESSDVHEGRTVFLRNLSFDVEEEELSEILKRFGEIKFCKIVQNPDTGFSKGSAFAQFLTKNAAEECVESLERVVTRVTLRGRVIFAALAQSRKNIETVLKDKKLEKEKKADKRNLYLANEGLIRPGTEAAKGLSEIELNKREKIEQAKRTKLKDPNVFVSTTRLCIHNIPRRIEDAELKKLVRQILGKDKRIRITEARIMRDLQRPNEKGKGRSLGYAFVNFTRHDHALRALREINNNPELFGPNKRPIVEFSLENRRALLIKEQRRRRQLSRNQLQKKMTASGVSKETPAPPLNKKARRIQKLREERKKKREMKNTALKGTNVTRWTAKVVTESSKQERKPFQGSSCMTTTGKKMKMSKHLGPKIRKRNKGKILDQLKESKKLNRRGPNMPKRPQENRREKQVFPAKSRSSTEGFKRPEKQKPGSRKRRRNTDLKEEREFNDLVAKYSKKFQSNFASQSRPQKWFET